MCVAASLILFRNQLVMPAHAQLSNVACSVGGILCSWVSELIKCMYRMYLVIGIQTNQIKWKNKPSDWLNIRQSIRTLEYCTWAAYASVMPLDTRSNCMNCCVWIATFEFFMLEMYRDSCMHIAQHPYAHVQFVPDDMRDIHFYYFSFFFHFIFTINYDRIIAISYNTRRHNVQA